MASQHLTTLTVGARFQTRRRPARGRDVIAYLLLLPGLALHIVVVGIPSVLTIALSTVEWNGIGAMRFVGIENFQRLLWGDPVFWRAFLNNLRWLAFFLTIPLAFGLIVAVILSQVRRGQTAYRTVLFLPYILSTVIVARLWMSIFHPFYGINAVTQSLGWDWARLNGLGDPSLSLYYIAVAANWHWWAFPMVIFLAALQQIDRSLYEAASVEGANIWQSFWYITVPLLRPTIVFLILMTVIWGFMAFDYVYIMTGGGPAHATELMATWIFSTAIESRQAGYASALAVALGVICSGVIVLHLYLRRQGWEV